MMESEKMGRDGMKGERMKGERMGNEKLLTVVVPTYNIEGYIERCVESVAGVRGNERVEVLVVNDGSTDGSSALAHGVEGRYGGVVRVIDKENGHYGSCVNRGIAEARGKYVKVLDGDDWFDTECFGEMLDAMECQDADLVMSDFAVRYEDSGRVEVHALDFAAGRVFDVNELLGCDALVHVWHQSLCYRRGLLEGYRQLERVHYTDVMWDFVPMCRVGSVYRFGGAVYYYRLGRPGQSVAAEVRRRNFGHEIKVTMAILVSLRGMVDAGVCESGRIERPLLERLKMLYRDAIVKGFADGDEGMVGLDALLGEVMPGVYEGVGRLRLSCPLLPLRYIRLWRRDRGSWLLRWCVGVYRLLHGC